MSTKNLMGAWLILWGKKSCYSTGHLKTLPNEYIHIACPVLNLNKAIYKHQQKTCAAGF